MKEDKYILFLRGKIRKTTLLRVAFLLVNYFNHLALRISSNIVRDSQSFACQTTQTNVVLVVKKILVGHSYIFKKWYPCPLTCDYISAEDLVLSWTLKKPNPFIPINKSFYFIINYNFPTFPIYLANLLILLCTYLCTYILIRNLWRYIAVQIRSHSQT